MKSTESRNQAYQRITRQLNRRIRHITTEGPKLLSEIDKYLSEASVSAHEREQLEAAKELVTRVLTASMTP